jgi:DNA-binding HxlR family transcriptional regulator
VTNKWNEKFFYSSKVRDIMSRIGDKRSMLSILHLGRTDSLRFNELRTCITGISQRKLTVTFRTLEADGLVTRTVYAGNHLACGL